MQDRFRRIFRGVHAGHARCESDEWLMHPCRLADGSLAERPIVWSRRNGPWQQVDVLWIGAAPGNAGGKGSGALGAHGTRIPFGGDVAGANLDVLLGSIGLTRNDTFITAALNRLPAAGGGEPTLEEVRAPVGDFASSVHVLRETVLAARPRLIVALGNVALRVLSGAVSAGDTGADRHVGDGRRTDLSDAEIRRHGGGGGLVTQRPPGEGVRLPSLARLRRAGYSRGTCWPLEDVTTVAEIFLEDWRRLHDRGALPGVLWLTHPSAQNMSPFAGPETLFFTRMLEARDALREAARAWLGCTIPAERPKLPVTGIYALPEWKELIGPRHARLDALWRARGI